jgi:hypothetical protein
MKRSMGISAVLAGLLFLGSAGLASAQSQCFSNVGIPDGAASLLGAKYGSFGVPADGSEVFLGGVPMPAISLAGVVWGASNDITLIFDPTATPPQLQTRIVPADGPAAGQQTVAVYAFQALPAGDLDFVHLSIAAQGGTVNFNGVTVDTCTVGNLGSGGALEALVANQSFAAGFTLEGTLVLTGNPNGNSSLEIVVGALNPVNQPPDCSLAAPSVDRLWPPNHKWKTVEVVGVTDPDGDPVTITIDSIFQDEPVNGRGDGNTSPDGQGLGSSAAQVRAERQGSGNGRVYHIGFTAADGNWGTCLGEVTVGVPKSQGKKWRVPVDEGPLYDSTLP